MITRFGFAGLGAANAAAAKRRNVSDNVAAKFRRDDLGARRARRFIGWGGRGEMHFSLPFFADACDDRFFRSDCSGDRANRPHRFLARSAFSILADRKLDFQRDRVREGFSTKKKRMLGRDGTAARSGIAGRTRNRRRVRTMLKRSATVLMRYTFHPSRALGPCMRAVASASPRMRRVAGSIRRSRFTWRAMLPKCMVSVRRPA